MMVPAKARRLLDFIGEIETRGDYEAIYGFNQDNLPKPLTQMTIAEVQASQRDWTRRFGSSAAGRYQIMRATLGDLIRTLRLTGRERFDPAMQDRLGYALLSRRGYHDFMAGRISAAAFGKNLAMEWASFPVLADTRGAHRWVERGESYYTGDALNKALVDPDRVEAVLHDLRDGAPAPSPKPLPPSPGPGESQLGQRVMPFVAAIIIIAVIAFVVWRIVS